MLAIRVPSRAPAASCPTTRRLAPCLRYRGASRLVVYAADAKGKSGEEKLDAEGTTEKYGLEAGLFKAMTEKPADGSKSRTQQAKDLLTKYGSAYLITSISFAVVSFAICYLAVDNGIDIAAILGKLGLQVSDKNENIGTAAIAYAAHKALSPVRFPPTVALTPVVAKFLGKKEEEEAKEGSN